MNRTIDPCIRLFLIGNAVYDRFMPQMIEAHLPVSRDNGIVVVRDEKDSNGVPSTFDVLKSSRIPSHTKLIALPQGMGMETLLPSVRDSILIIDDWTFYNSESLETARKYRSEYPYCELTIVLCPSNRRTLSTDVTDLQRAMDDAVTAYQNEGFSTVILNPKSSEISALLYWKGRSYTDILKQDFRRHLQEAKEFLEFNFDLEYSLLYSELEDETLQQHVLNGLICYDAMLEGAIPSKHLINTSVYAFFSAEGMFFLEMKKLFQRCTKQICLWDEEKIHANLLSLLTKRFRNDLKEELPQVPFLGGGRIAYVEFMHETKLEVKFQQSCYLFFEQTAKHIIKTYIESVISNLEGFL
ncbi:hypothetical protein [Paenibacillus sp. MER 99-2]|uniref:hypothetical protein n=1 Tax=Paenibacillus sp. MER 99-2 TaxID=2939572 RepID=UPI00203CED52|nr:hypothetical protein [Paenibacillus sp. MER 99-2]MCM3174400.1 hypothetical protein [Paenibacillus sp. MER 99-2]